MKVPISPTCEVRDKDSVCGLELQRESERLFDLVRYQRIELHEAGLITNEEYAALCEGGSTGSRKGSRQRLESYDELQEALRFQNLTLAAQVEKMRKYCQHIADTARAQGRGTSVELDAILETPASTILAKHDAEIRRPLVEALRLTIEKLRAFPPIAGWIVERDVAISVALSATEGTKQ